VTDELAPSEAAALLGATTRTVQRWIATGRLPARRIGGRWRVRRDAVVSLIDGGSSARASAPIAPSTIATLFVANRGEIARRIATTARGLGIRTIVPGTGDAAAVDLLDAEAIANAALAAGADAVHPGYGFLSESPVLAEAIGKAGMRWVGPPPDALAAMGDKAAARRLAATLGVPLVPGYDGDDQSDGALHQEARRLGFPVLIKPAAGGGGKGMRTVRDQARFLDELAAARREATAAFGDPRVVLERLVEGPRHVEIQVLFDAHGSGVHLGERDCSIQRRHQKVLEESPSPGVDAALRSRLGEAALRLGAAVGYVGAGTCEFLLDERGRFYFLEMNARLQVEHAVTEAITGRDLVADQLAIAAGATLADLGLDQATLDQSLEDGGHAVEARLYAEDAEDGFLPATGRIVALRWPPGASEFAWRSDVRVDAGIEVGVDVGGRFDPLLAKVMARGATRDDALDRLATALDETLVLGLTTNLRFLRWLVRSDAVRRGQARIDTLGRVWPPDDWATENGIPDAAWTAAATALAASTAGDASPNDPWSGGWRLNAARRIVLSADGMTRFVDVDRAPSAIETVVEADTVYANVGGRSVEFHLASPPHVDRAGGGPTGGAAEAADLVTPMPGIVIAVHARRGDTVEAGAPILTLEAMKMEHPVTAPIDGRLEDVTVGVGDQVVRGQAVGRIAPDDQASDTLSTGGET
jgi:excisionase family DNA binding protein